MTTAQWVIFGGQAVQVITSGVFAVSISPTRLTANATLDNTMQLVFANTKTTSAFTVTLAPTPADGQMVQIVDDGIFWSSRNLTIQANAGQQLVCPFPQAFVATSVVLNVAGASPTWRYDASQSLWLVM
jgi:multisubunit Na+/H+ antiporter MnhC subunit